MKIGVISDTHIMNKSRLLSTKVFEAFSDVDLIIHAGDIMIEEVIIELQSIAPVNVVAGNNDGYEIYSKYEKRKIIEVQGKRIGVTHGYGRGRTYLNAYAEFLNDEVDCIVYGHSHAPHNEIIDDILFFNPGSPTNKRLQARYSVGILYIQDLDKPLADTLSREFGNGIAGEIIYFD
jgi:hypothetical protein